MIKNYVKIPIKNKEEGIDIVHQIYGPLYWQTIDNDLIRAFPINVDNPVEVFVQSKKQEGKNERGVF